MKLQQIDDKDFLSFITIKRGLANESIRHCMSRLKNIKLWFGTQDLTKENVEKFYLYLKGTKKLKNNSLNTYHFCFFQLVEYCKDRKLPHDFFDGFTSFKKTKPDIVIFTPEEIEKIINQPLKYGKQYGKDMSFLDFRYRTMIMFLAYTGCRYSEAANLLIKRIDLSAGRATFVDTKTNENRSVYFTEPLKTNLAKLMENRKPDEHVFRNSREVQVQVSDFSQDLKRRAKTAGVMKRVFPHNFRHSYITHLLEAGVPITEVASLVGHKDIQTTYSNYMHLADDTLRKAALRHPLVVKNVDPHEIIRTVKGAIENFRLEGDKRFKFEISETSQGLSFDLKIL